MAIDKITKRPPIPCVVARARPHIVVELIEYEHNAVITKTILKRALGTVSAMSFDSGQGLQPKASAFDTYLQLIEGSATIVIAGKTTLLQTGQGIVIPAHAFNHIEPNGRFKMIVTVIKNGYELQSIC